ncbi:unnamed protein product [Paramecium pentaurelia]|uniref:Uncharacterized protein n=1 Tax=Paramecium pentaurelia TaxID=43138 RepID=A0A8S1VL41_9CILI|nr:unnamed protein product [Paramecium pentaurelia]
MRSTNAAIEFLFFLAKGFILGRMLQRLNKCDLNFLEYFKKFPHYIEERRDQKKIELAPLGEVCLPGSISEFAQQQQIQKEKKENNFFQISVSSSKRAKINRYLPTVNLKHCRFNILRKDHLPKKIWTTNLILIYSVKNQLKILLLIEGYRYLSLQIILQ